MGMFSGRYRHLILLVALLTVALVPGVARAQTTLVTNPTTLVFTPSTDHSATLGDGRQAVAYYEFNVYAVGAAQPFQRTNIGKPSPSADGLIHYNFSNTVASWPLPGGNYEARVAAVGPEGSGLSSPSNPFTFGSCAYTLSGTGASLPAAGGGTQVGVTTSSGCTWTAASSVSWVALSTSSGSGNGTVVATVAANTSTASRTATLTVAGKAFTINQAGTGASAPAAPGSPTPASGASSVSLTPTLSWSASGATSYVVRFGTSNPPPQVVSGVTTPTYTPAALTAGRTYYWQVVAANAGGSATGPVWSFTTAASGTTPVPPQALPTPWRNQDIGSVGLSGSATYASGQFSVAGAGADIWGAADGFQYVYQPLNGNGQIVARMTREQNTNYYAKAGVMLRATLAANSAHVTLDAMPNGNIEFLKRASTGGSTTSVASASQGAPSWLRLVRNGTTVTASVSADGTTWRTVGSTSVTMGTSVYVGLCVTSHNTSLRNTATFDNVTVGTQATAGLPAPWASQDIGSVGLSGSTSYSSGRFTVTGAGADIWGAADAFQYAYQPLAGDGQVVARLVSEQNTSTYAKAGVMLRAGLGANAAHVILDVNPSGNVEFMKRSSTGGSTTYLAGTRQTAPAWLRLVRTGTTVTASVSADGTTWRTVGSTTIGWSGGYVGLAVTSHNTGLRNTATFDSVTVR